MISTSEQRAEHPFASRNTQQEREREREEESGDEIMKRGWKFKFLKFYFSEFQEVKREKIYLMGSLFKDESMLRRA